MLSKRVSLYSFKSSSFGSHSANNRDMFDNELKDKMTLSNHYSHGHH